MSPKSPIISSRLQLVLLFVLAVVLTTFKIRTFDVWMLILNGRRFLSDLKVSLIEDFSYTSVGTTWVNQEWLSEVILALVYGAGGFFGLITLKTICVVAALFLLGQHFKKNGVDAGIAFWILAVVLFLSRFHLTVGPQMFSFVFMAGISALLYDYKNNKRDSLWICVPVFWLWTNVHYASVLGMVLFVMYILAALLALGLPKFFDGNLKRDVNGAMLGHLCLVLVCSVVVSLANPSTIGFLSAPIETAYLSVKHYVVESMPARIFGFGLFPLFWLSLLAYTLIIFRSLKTVDIFDMLVFLLSAGLALKMIRFIPFYAIVTAPIVACQITALIKRRKLFGGLVAALRSPKVMIGATAVCAIGVLVLPIGGLKNYEFGYGRSVRLQPTDAVEFLKKHDIQGNIFNEVNWGGYLLFERYPKNRVFMYPRHTVFGDYIYEAYYRVLIADPKWQEILNQYPTDIILLSRMMDERAPLAKALRQAPNWSQVFKGKKSVMYLKHRPQFKHILQDINRQSQMKRQ